MMKLLKSNIKNIKNVENKKFGRMVYKLVKALEVFYLTMVVK